MAENSGMSKMAGKFAHFIAIAGLAGFFLGLFGWGKTLMLGGIALIVVSLVAYYIEELAQRKRG